MKALGQFEAWLVTGSQQLYGDKVLGRVDEHSREVAESLNDADVVPVRVVHKPVVTSADSIRRLCMEANATADCVGVMSWMHTFSPAKMWIAGLAALQKPLLHLHTQFNRDLPWGEIDMDFMNLNQSAHGDREFGFIGTRMGLKRKTVVGHWRDPSVVGRIGTWSRAACGWREAQTLNVARFGDNMRHVAVTEGDKVEAQLRLGITVNGYGIGDLVDAVRDVSDASVDVLVDEYEHLYTLMPALREGEVRRESLRDAARIEAGLRSFLETRGSKAFTDTFEDLDGLLQLPGIAVQRLMADGYGFGGEGDWKTAALAFPNVRMTSPARTISRFASKTCSRSPLNTVPTGATYSPRARWKYAWFHRSSFLTSRMRVSASIATSSSSAISARSVKTSMSSDRQKLVWCAPPASSQASAAVARSGFGSQTARATGSRGKSSSGGTTSTSFATSRKRSPRSTRLTTTAGPGAAVNTSRTGSCFPPIDSGWISQEGF